MNSKKSSDSQILAVLGIFFIQLFPNWTACSPITYTYLHVYNVNGSSPADYSELFWGPEGREEYDVYQDGIPNTWCHCYRINQATEYYDPENDWGEQDSVLRLNNNLYSEWFDN